MNNKFIWLFAENRGNTANNNSFYFWKHVVKIEDEIEKYFIMDRNEANRKVYENLESYEKSYVVWKNSMKHYLLYLNADMYFITLGGKDIVPDKFFGKNVNFAPNKPIIRLGHGNLAIKKTGYTGRSYANNMLRCLYFNPMIKETFMEKNNFKEYQLYYSDYLPRYKELFLREQNRVKKDTKNIVWFLTWREYFGDNIETIIFMHRLKSVFTDERLEKYLREHNVKFTLCVHQFFDEGRLATFQEDFERLGIIVKYATQTDVMDEIVNNDVLITDYSSLGFDFTVLRKPVILYQPDLNEYLEKRELYCELEDLEKYSYRSEKELIDCIINENYGVNEFFLERSVKEVDAEYVRLGKHIDRMYEDFRKMQIHKITFLGYNFYGEGGTVFATRALAEALMEKGYLVELRSLKKNGKVKKAPFGLNMTFQYDSPSKRKYEVIRRNLFRADFHFDFLKYDKNMKNLVPYAERSLRKLLKTMKSETVISTRESLHLFLKEASSKYIKNKIYFYHCPAEIFDNNFPGCMERLKKIQVEKAVFVTDNNRKLFKEKFGLENYNDYLVLGNAIESSRSQAKAEIHPVEKKEVYRGIYLVRIDETRKDDLNNVIEFGKYLRDHDIQNVKVDIYGTGSYLEEFLDIIGSESLFGYITCKGVTSELKEVMESYDAVTDFSMNHSFGMPYIEGVLNGKMVFCMKNTGSSEVLSEMPESFIKSHEDLVEKMCNLPNITVEQLQKNYEIVSRRYSREVIADKFIEFINE